MIGFNEVEHWQGCALLVFPLSHALQCLLLNTDLNVFIDIFCKKNVLWSSNLEKKYISSKIWYTYMLNDSRRLSLAISHLKDLGYFYGNFPKLMFYSIYLRKPFSNFECKTTYTFYELLYFGGIPSNICLFSLFKTLYLEIKPRL